MLSLAGASPTLLAFLPLVVVGVSAIAAALAPHPEPGTAWAKLRAVLDLLAANVGSARNRGPQ